MDQVVINSGGQETEVRGSHDCFFKGVGVGM